MLQTLLSDTHGYSQLVRLFLELVVNSNAHMLGLNSNPMTFHTKELHKDLCLLIDMLYLLRMQCHDLFRMGYHFQQLDLNIFGLSRLVW